MCIRNQYQLTTITNILVTVPPTMPGDFRVEQSSITSVFARIRWTITNQTQDEGAETLTLLLTYSNMSLVQEIILPGDATLVALDLIPGTEYTVRLRAENPSGMVITDAVPFTTLTGSKYTCTNWQYYMYMSQYF